MLTFSIARASSVLATVITLFATLCGRVVYLQSIGRQNSISRAERQQHQNIILQARRGGFFDRNGILMAGTVQTQTLFIDPEFCLAQLAETGLSKQEQSDKLGMLAALIDKTPAALNKLLADHADKQYIKVAEAIDDETAAQIEQLNLPGVGLSPTSQRVYPMGSTACHILGGVGSDGAGIEGAELKFNKLLAGVDGFERLTKDARRRPIGVASDDYTAPQHGQHVVLSIDSNIQMIAEEELAATCVANKAKRGELVVMDPKTGEILALVNWLEGYPSFNPANLDDSPPIARLNRAVAVPYEPGSTFKPFIAGPALMWGVTNPAEVWPVEGKTYIAPDGRHVSDVHPFTHLNTWDALVHSSNICMSMLGERLGNPRLYAAITSFGFGTRTGVDLPGEDPGLVRPLAKWSHFSTESVSQGYEVMVTPIQLARAFCAVANGGHLVNPHIQLGTLDEDGSVLARTHAVDFDNLPRVLSDETTAQLRRILCDVVIRGTANGNCRSPIWNISAKTGTSHISEGKAGYSATRFNSSFMACAPAENPRLVIACIVHDPGTSVHYGGLVAGPGASRVLSRALTYMQVPASPPLTLPPPEVVEHLLGYQEKQLLDRTFAVAKADRDE